MLRDMFSITMSFSALSGASPPIHLRITKAAESEVRSGHPWVFAESIREQNKPGRAGDFAVVFDRRDRFLAIGLFDPASPIRMRILHAGHPQTLDDRWWRERLDTALAKRRNRFDDRTTGYRLIHGENDAWPGLVLDRYDSTAVLKIYTAAWFPHLDLFLKLLKETNPWERVVLRLSRNLQTSPGKAPNRNFHDGQILFGAAPNGPVQFQENGLRFEADVLRGQKTGFFLDQRENREEIEKLSRGRQVLNAFSYSGGFSVYAARGRARSVTDLDISPHALRDAQTNWSLNQKQGAIPSASHEGVQADAFAWLPETSRKFDLIILDPPSLARREIDRRTALSAYSKLAGAAMRALRPHGILAAASCSAHVGRLEFFETIRSAARQAGRSFAELKTTGHPADHPVGFPEGEYLKCIYLELE